MNELTKPALKKGQIYEILPDGRWAFFIDSSSLRSFTDCEAYFEMRHVRNIQKRGRTIKTDLGSWWSTTMELYYNAMRSGDLTITNAVDFALHAWDEKNMEQLRATHPKSYSDFGGKLGATEMVAEYFQQFYDYDKRHWTIVSVEEGSGRLRELMLAENDRVVVYYIVKPDLFIIEDDKYLFPVDHKTKDLIDPRLIYTFKPSQQMMGYIVAAQDLAKSLGLTNFIPDKCMMNVAARNTPGPRSKRQDRPRFQRIPVDYSQAQLHEWRLRVLDAVTRMRYCFETNTWQWNDSSCHKYSGCSYRPIHSAPPDSRPIIIKSAYDIGTPWSPYDVESDEEGGVGTD